MKWNLEWSRFSSVGCGIGEFRLPIHSIDINYFAAVRLCWRKCVEAGHQRIAAALFRQPGSDQNDSLRYAAVLYEQSKLPASAPRIPIFDGAFSDKADFGAWVRKHRPTAVIALNALAYWHLRDLGLRIPEDISFCLATHPGVGTESVAGAATQRHRIAELAVNWLDQLLRTNECGLPAVPDEILIEPRWIEGPSLAAPPSDSAPRKSVEKTLAKPSAKKLPTKPKRPSSGARNAAA